MDRKKNFFDKLGSLIPGYSGYLQRDGRRNCDRILRDKLSSDLKRIESEVSKKMEIDVINKNYDELKKKESLRKKINTLSDKVRYAPYGVTAFFSDNKIKENELENIYQYDLELSSNTEDLFNLIGELDLEKFSHKLEIIENTLNSRNDYINEFKN